jgi:hypothetical protein
LKDLESRATNKYLLNYSSGRQGENEIEEIFEDNG